MPYAVFSLSLSIQHLVFIIVIHFIDEPTKTYMYSIILDSYSPIISECSSSMAHSFESTNILIEPNSL